MIAKCVVLFFDIMQLLVLWKGGMERERLAVRNTGK